MPFYMRLCAFRAYAGAGLSDERVPAALLADRLIEVELIEVELIEINKVFGITDFLDSAPPFIFFSPPISPSSL